MCLCTIRAKCLWSSPAKNLGLEHHPQSLPVAKDAYKLRSSKQSHTGWKERDLDLSLDSWVYFWIHPLTFFLILELFNLPRLFSLISKIGI